MSQIAQPPFRCHRTNCTTIQGDPKKKGGRCTALICSSELQARKKHAKANPDAPKLDQHLVCPFNVVINKSPKNASFVAFSKTSNRRHNILCTSTAKATTNEMQLQPDVMAAIRTLGNAKDKDLATLAKEKGLNLTRTQIGSERRDLKGQKSLNDGWNWNHFGKHVEVLAAKNPSTTINLRLGNDSEFVSLSIACGKPRQQPGSPLPRHHWP